jgi:hypothetical protein
MINISGEDYNIDVEEDKDNRAFGTSKMKQI